MAQDSKTIFAKYIFPVIGIVILFVASWRNQGNAPGPGRKPVSSAANSSLPVAGGAYDLGRDEGAGGHTLARLGRTDSRSNLVIHCRGREPAGRSIRRGGNSVQTCYNAIIVLRSNDNGGFYVLTTYPEA